MKINTADPETACIVNRLAILNRLRRIGPASRAVLSRELKLSKVTISSVVDDLIRDKFVIEQAPENASAKGGRKPIPIALNDKSGVVQAGDYFTYPLKSVYKQNTMDVIKKGASLQISELGNEAGLLGALSLALNASVFQIGFE